VNDSLRILLVDDDQVDRMAVRRALRRAGVQAEVEESDSVDGAIEALRTGSFDCVLLDYQLPGGDGLRVVRTARGNGMTLPIIVLTGQGDDEVAVKLMKAGASDYLTKESVSPERLERTLRSALRVHEAQMQALEAQRALRASEARFRILHETSPDGFLIFRSLRDEEGRIRDFVLEYSNPAADRIGSRNYSRAWGQRLLEMLPGIVESGLFDLYCEVVETGEPRQRELHYTYDGLDIWVRITAARLEDGFAVSYADVSRRKRAEEERERAIAARGRFYAAMSHEIRTPMNAILGYTDLLLAGAYGALAPQQREGIQRTYRAAQHLLELVNDVLDLSKLEAGKLEVQLEPVTLSTLVQDLFTTIQPVAQERRTPLRFVSDGREAPLMTDPRRLRQILLNLISNAIKFGRSQPVEVSCRLLDDGRYAVEVRDQGMGIEPENISRIFEEFVQLGESEERGTGLGLPISRRIAELLGGSLDVESAPGVGSTFRLILPAAAPALAAEEIATPA
jgi:signal transduction histidine kinase